VNTVNKVRIFYHIHYAAGQKMNSPDYPGEFTFSPITSSFPDQTDKNQSLSDAIKAFSITGRIQ
jgi:hypothetical protein